MNGERLQKIIARAGLASRRKAEALILEGRVTVNGRAALLGDKADPRSDLIRVDGRVVRLPRHRRYLLLNKPRGHVTTCSDPQSRLTVFDLIPADLRPGLVPAGRLDFDSEGLLVLTDDGDLVHRITHPRYGCEKTYAVKVKGVPDDTKVARLRTGIVIDGKRTAPAVIRLRRRPRAERGEKNSWWTVVLVEGRKGQIREMFFRIGHPVQRLIRVGIGGLRDPRLPSGGFRHLTRNEVARLRGASRPGAAPGKRSRRSAHRPRGPVAGSRRRR